MSANLNAPVVTSGQANKTVTINDAVGALDAAVTEVLALNAATLPLTVTTAQLQRAAVLVFSGQTAAGVVNIPAIKRLFAVSNTGGSTLTLTVGTATVALATMSTMLVYTDGTANGLFAISGGAGSGGGGGSGADVNFTDKVIGNGTDMLIAPVTTGSGSSPTARYWRIVFTVGGSESNIALSELAYHTTVGGAAVEPGTAVASSHYTGGGSNDAPNLIDGDTSTAWASATTGPDNIDYTYATAQTFVEVKLTARNDSYYHQGPATARVYTSTDGSTWTAAGAAVTLAAWTSAAQTQTISIGTAATTTPALLKNTRYRAPSYTVATLPTTAVAGDVVYASDLRVFNGTGTQEGAGVGTGGLVSYNGSAWKIAGTNVTAVA